MSLNVNIKFKDNNTKVKLSRSKEKEDQNADYLKICELTSIIEQLISNTYNNMDISKLNIIIKEEK